MDSDTSARHPATRTAGILPPGAAMTVALAAGGLAAVALLRLPVTALLVWAAFGTVLGLLGCLWHWLVSDAHPARHAPLVPHFAALGVAVGLALAGLVLVCGPATVAVLPALTLAGAGFWLWQRSNRVSRRDGRAVRA